MRYFHAPFGHTARRAVLIAALASSCAIAATAATACTAGEEECPAVLKMAPGATSITATGSVSGERPNYYFKLEARAGQNMTLHVVGGGLKTGPGIPITLPDGSSDAVDVDTPYRLPASGVYVILLHANTMSNGPFGRFTMTLTIK